MGTTTTDLQAEVNRLRHKLQSLEAESEEGELITIADYILARLEQLNVTVCVCSINCAYY